MNSSRTCSVCGSNGHNSRTCSEAGKENGIMLFGVRLTDGGGAFRKSVSMNNLSQYEPLQDSNNAESGYASDDVVYPSSRCRERKRGVPWSEEEHKLFLVGLEKVGKGDWRGISRNFVKTRTPTQVASHAQKYLLRRNGVNRRRRRSSLFDITTDTLMNPSMEEIQQTPHEAMPPPLPQLQPQKEYCKPEEFSAKIHSVMPHPAGDNNTTKNSLTMRSNSQAKTRSKIISPKPIIPLPPYSKLAHLNIKEISSKDPSFQAVSSGGDSIDLVSVA